jgi:hypothetical protein
MFGRLLLFARVLILSLAMMRLMMMIFSLYRLRVFVVRMMTTTTTTTMMVLAKDLLGW